MVLISFNIVKRRMNDRPRYVTGWAPSRPHLATRGRQSLNKTWTPTLQLLLYCFLAWFQTLVIVHPKNGPPHQLPSIIKLYPLKITWHRRRFPIVHFVRYFSRCIVGNNWKAHFKMPLAHSSSQNGVDVLCVLCPRHQVCAGSGGQQCGLMTAHTVAMSGPLFCIVCIPLRQDANRLP